MDFSLDEENDDEEQDVRGKAKPAHSIKQPSKSASNVTTTSKRVSLSDSEDYGVSSYDDDNEPRTKQQSAAGAPQRSAQPVARATKEESESDDEDGYRRRPSALKVAMSRPSAQTVTTQQRKVESSSEDEEEKHDAVASFMDESEEGDLPPFSAVVSSKTASAAPAATKIEPKSVISQVSITTAPSLKAYNDEDESNGEESDESIASKSEYAESFEEDLSVSTKPSAAILSSATAQNPTAAAAIDSGIYEEEDFDEESSVAPSSSAPQSRIASTAQKTTLEDSAKSEPNFDYSMDFSDDNGGEGKPDETKLAEPSMHVIPEAGTQPVSERSSSSSPLSRSDASERSGRSEFLDSDRSGDDDYAKDELVLHVEQESDHAQDSSDTSPPPVSDPSKFAVGESATMAAVASDFTANSNPETRCAVDTLAKQPELQSVASKAIRPHAAAVNAPAVTGVEPSAAMRDTSQAFNASRSHLVATASTTRSRVLIVREYELPTSERIEMKDASTQFTGNHAAVQADFTPDGMHNLTADPLPPETTPTQPSMQHHVHPQSSVQSPVREQSRSPVDASCYAAAPSPAPILSSPGYSMDALRLPSATTTSIYKQQLLALQEQILAKRRETERLVRERMTFQYSTFRGTERVRWYLLCCICKQLISK